MEILSFEISNWIVWLFVFIVLFYVYSIWPYGVFKQLGIPGPKPVPFIGNLGMVMRMGLTDADMELVKKYGKAVGYYEGRHPMLLISDRDVLKAILVKEFANFTNRRVFKIFGPPLDKGVIALENDEWKHMRSIMTPVFSSGRMRKMVPLMSKSAGTLADVLLEKAQRGEEFEAKALFGCFAMDTIALTMFGVEVDSQRDPNDPFVANALNAVKFSALNPFILIALFFPILITPLSWLKLAFLPKHVTNFFVNVITSVVRQRKEDPSTKRDDLIGLLLEEDKSLSDEDLFAQSLTFFLAGYETTSGMMAFFFYCMAMYPEWQDRLRQEANSIENLDYESLSSLRHLDHCIKESMRLYPPALRFDRIAKTDCEINEIPILRGMCVGVPVYAIHHDPERWPDPEEFRPERFETEPEICDYMPFGNGPRACLGMRFAMIEAKLAIAKVLMKVRIVRCDRTQSTMKFAPGAFLTPAGGIWLKAEVLDQQ